MEVTIAAIMWNSYIPLFVQAAKKHNITLYIHATRELEEKPEIISTALAEMKAADIIFLYRTGSLFWDEIEDQIRTLGQKKPIVSVGYESSYWLLSNVASGVVMKAYTYIMLNGARNCENLLLYLCNELLHLPYDPLPPEQIPWEGIYHPGAATYFTTISDYLSWYSRKEQPWVGILLSRTAWITGNHAIEDRIIRDLEEEGLNVIPVFSYAVRDLDLGTRGMAQIIRDIFLSKEAPRLRALIKLTSFFIGSEKSGESGSDTILNTGRSIVKELGVPVFQPIISYYRNLSDWEAGIDLTDDIGWSVSMPEFEGVIEPILVGAQEGYGEESGSRRPIPERCKKLASRVANWVRLAEKPVSERKVAFVLLSSPCAGVEATIGSAAHLDALASMAHILSAMHDAGYSVTVPESGEEIIREFLDKKAISEFRWTTAADIVRLGGCIDRIGPDEYNAYFATLPKRTQREVTEVWGESPGTAMVHEGTILITGLMYGNALLCIQPKRGCAGARCDGEVCKILHDPLVPPTHQYLATYHYLQSSFGADILVHVGTHGNLEFLPGKGVGLSSHCYPDITIGSIPHLYIYNADNPPEGTIAKRRSYACLIDHLQTVMTAGELYDELLDLDQLIHEYETAQYDRARAHALQHEIIAAVHAAHLENEVAISHDTPIEDVIPHLHETLTRIRQTRIPAGMHIFGTLPEGERRTAFIYAILAYESGEGSLRDYIATQMGLSLPDLLDHRDGFHQKYQRSHGALLADIEEKALAMVQDILDRADTGTTNDPLYHPPDPVFDHLAERIGDLSGRLTESDEIRSLLHGFGGHYITPGPSGLITRGRDDVLPTGRNFYSLDPHRLPTHAAYTVGQQLAHALLAKYVGDHGSLPESVGFYWMANDVMWTDGEGLAQMFALVGVQPVWHSNGRVKGIEVIPLETLGRPRIDVLAKSSGIIRDNFSNLFDLLDNAIQTVASLDEPDALNFVRKHVQESMREENTFRDATIRIFSSRPGTYSAGVNLAVFASAWKEEEDLADIFLAYNGFGYGQNLAGSEVHSLFADRLSEVDVTFNKMPSDEYDLFGCCCYFSNQGGMTAAARRLTGKEIKAYFGDTREADHAEVRDLADEIRRVVRGKILNPKWIDGLKEHGYAGAADISKRIGRVYGWEATTREVDDWIFDEIAETFVNNPEMKEFFEEKNPYALEEISRRLLEAHTRGLWQADPDVLQRLQESYLEVESWMEDQDHEGEFQGGTIDLVGYQDIEQWDESMLKYLNQIKKRDRD
ncbi:MAG: cobaltochelatase subunit CobN [Methanospirillaceae archaeon]|nr:cobaltochelatase subunit CobN [Methanospirillaceae archaeon]